MLDARLSLTILCTMLVPGCAHDKRPEPAARTPAQHPVIVHVVSRQETITISASPRGPLYSVTSIDGRTVVADATLAELRAQHPELYQRIAPAIAEQTADLSANRASSMLAAPGASTVDWHTRSGGPAAEGLRLDSAE